MFIKTKAELEVQQMKQYAKEQEDIKHIKVRQHETLTGKHEASLASASRSLALSLPLSPSPLAADAQILCYRTCFYA